MTKKVLWVYNILRLLEAFLKEEYKLSVIHLYVNSEPKIRNDKSYKWWKFYKSWKGFKFIKLGFYKGIRFIKLWFYDRLSF